MADFIVLTLLGAAVFFVLRYRWKSGKEGGCSCGCGGTSEGCKSCKKRNIK
ncbi:MAG: FeoB-associated Cys-rich membrane protein [Lachnospiraceae bacterium]|nr:FeoB-associated Cys-rich membrane protein [Lachnospiraceae bacterium]